MKPRVLITGGGTGGHVYPLLAVAQKLRGVELRYFGDAGAYQNLLENSGIKVSSVVSSKMRRYFSILNFFDFFKFCLGLCESLWKIYWFMPDAAFSKGGPGVLPILLACRFYFIPVIIHESDAIPGLTSRISARFSKIINVAFPAAAAYFPKNKTSVSGQPTREEILLEKSFEGALETFGFSAEKPVLLFLGGSQGSEALNDFMLENLEKLLERFQIIHQVGQANFESYKQEYAFTAQNISPTLKRGYWFAGYLGSEYLNALTAAEIVVSRAGAGAIFETAAKGKPAILIPLPESANGHQEANAYEYQKSGAALVIEQANLLPNLFISVVDELLKDPAQLNKMKTAAKNFYKPEAARIIAEQIKSFTI